MSAEGTPSDGAEPTAGADPVDHSLRDASVLDRDGYAYVVHPLTDGVPRAGPELLDAWCSWAQAQGLHEQANVLLAPEAMALPLAAALGLRVRIPYLVVRKRRYGLEGEEAAYAETGYGDSTLYLNDVRPGDRVLVVDDVVSTGNTVTALVTALRQRGVQVMGVLAFMDKNGVCRDLQKRLGVPLKAMRTIRVADGRVVVEGASGT